MGSRRSAALAGCAGEPAPLDAGTIRSLGLGDSIADARIATAPAHFARCSLEIAGDAPLRELIPRLAARLATRAPHVLWLVRRVAARDARHGASRRGLATGGRRASPRSSSIERDSSTATPRHCVRWARRGSDRDVLTHARWVETLGREALTVRFYRALETSLTALADSSRACAARCAARARAARDVASVVPVVSRGQRLARRRSRVHRAPVRSVHVARRAVSRSRASAAVLRHAQHARSSTRARRRPRSAPFRFSTAGSSRARRSSAGTAVSCSPTTRTAD